MSLWRTLARLLHGVAERFTPRRPDLPQVIAERIRSEGRRSPGDHGEAYCTGPVRPASVERPLSGPEFMQLRDPWLRIVNAHRDLDAALDALERRLAPLYLIGGAER